MPIRARHPGPIIGALLWLAPVAGSAWAEGAHVHGQGHMNVAIEGAQLMVEIGGPGANFVGFEHSPENAGQRAMLASAERLLRHPTRLLALPPAAGCSLREMDLDIPAASPGSQQSHRHDDHDHGKHDHGGEHHGQHDDWNALYRFSCATPGALTSIRTAPWFRSFPNTRALQVQVISRFGQSGMTLTPALSRILLRTR